MRQPLEALELANQIRKARADWKREVAENRSLILNALCDPPEWLLTAKVQDLLKAVPKFGPVKIAKIMRATGVSPSVTVGGLTDRQRVLLLRDLKERV